MLPPIDLDNPLFSVRVRNANMNDVLTLFRPVFLRMGINKFEFKDQLSHLRREFYSKFVRTAFRQYLIGMRTIKGQVARRTRRALRGRLRILEEDRKEDAIAAEIRVTDMVSRPGSTRRSALGSRLMGTYMRSTGIDERLRIRNAIRNRQFRLLMRKLDEMDKLDKMREEKLHLERSDEEKDRDEAKNSFALDQMLHHDAEFVRSVYEEFPIMTSKVGSRLEKYRLSFYAWCMHIREHGVRTWEEQNTARGNMTEFSIKFDNWKKRMPILRY